jgi:hypothetical protein
MIWKPHHFHSSLKFTFDLLHHLNIFPYFVTIIHSKYNDLPVKPTDKSVESSFEFSDFKNQILIDFQPVFSGFDEIDPDRFYLR